MILDFFLSSFILSIMIGIFAPFTPNADPPNFAITNGSNTKINTMSCYYLFRYSLISLAALATPFDTFFPFFIREPERFSSIIVSSL